MITPGQALWIINNLPQNPPSSSIMPSVWQNSRRQVVEELQAIVAAEQSVHLTVLPVREIETVCPHCSLVFDVPVPEPHASNACR